MGVFSFETEVCTVIPPARMFNALVLDADNLVSKVLPNAIHTVEVIEGDGGPGTIKKITFNAGGGVSYVKHKVESIDSESLSYSYSVIEGNSLANKFEKINYETTLLPTPDGGSIFKSISHYYTLDDAQVDENEIKAGKEKAVGIFKAIEVYLLKNPDEYN